MSPENGSGDRVKIHLLPNLFTAGNLACGFFALTWIFKYAVAPKLEYIQSAIYLILAAFAFDFFDGRVARVMRKESPFGREFDSLADLVSFGVAPAFLVYSIILQEFEKTGWMVAAIYLVCGGIRLARFNVLTLFNEGKGKPKDTFIGLPIPSGAALVVSVTWFMLWIREDNIIAPRGSAEHPLGPLRFVLPALMLLVSGLMISNVRYPNFKQVEWTARRSVAAFAALAVAMIFFFRYPEVTFALLFVAYLLYGLIRPWISKRWRHEIEEEDEEENGRVAPDHL